MKFKDSISDDTMSKPETLADFCLQAVLIELCFTRNHWKEDETTLCAALTKLCQREKHLFTREHVVAMDLYFNDLLREGGTAKNKFLACPKMAHTSV